MKIAHRIAAGGVAAAVTLTLAAAEASPVLPPVAAFTIAPVPGVAGEPVVFDASGSTTSGPLVTIVLYEWDFDFDGTFTPEFSSRDEGPVFRSFPFPGLYVVVLEVEDSNGLTDSERRELLVLPAPEPAAASLLLAGLAGLALARRRSRGHGG